MTFDLSIYDAAVARGFSFGPGSTETPCVMHAVALACGLGSTDRPTCVSEVDRVFEIRLNDANWPDKVARARAMRPLGILAIGTVGTDRGSWLGRIVEGTIRRVVPIYLRDAASKIPAHADALRVAADRCERDGNREAALAGQNAADAAYAAYAAYAAADAAYAAHAYAAHAYAADADAYAADAYAADASAYAADAADASAYAADAADASAYAADAADAYVDYAVRHRALLASVQVAIDAYAAEGRTVESVLRDLGVSL